MAFPALEHYPERSMPLPRLGHVPRWRLQVLGSTSHEGISELALLPSSFGLQYFLPWMSLIRTWGMRAVVLNRGAHYTPTAEFEEQLELTMLVLRKRYPDLLIMYRATAPGHDKCEGMEVPLESPQDGASLPYNWGEMHRQNLAAKRIVEKYGGVYIDIEPMTVLRGDGHRGHVRKLRGWVHDCLHYCNPGPVDEWNRLLQNALSRVV